MQEEHLEKDIKKKRKAGLIVLTVISFITALFGLAYAYWILTRVQEDTNIIEGQCLSFDVDFEEGIAIEDAWPKLDEVGILEPGYQFTVINNCDRAIDYEVGFIDQTTNPGNEFKYSSIKTSIDGVVRLVSDISNSTYGIDNDISNTTKTLKYYTVSANGSNVHEYKMWIDSSSTAEEQGHEFEIKMFVRAGQGIEKE